MIKNVTKVSKRDITRMTESQNYDARNNVIADLYKTGKYSTRSLADRVGMSKSRVAEIVQYM